MLASLLGPTRGIGAHLSIDGFAPQPVDFVTCKAERPPVLGALSPMLGLAPSPHAPILSAQSEAGSASRFSHPHRHFEILNTSVHYSGTARLPRCFEGYTQRSIGERSVRKSLAMVFLSVFVLSGAATILSACNTLSGAGQDVSSAGRAVSNTSQRVKPY